MRTGTSRHPPNAGEPAAPVVELLYHAPLTVAVAVANRRVMSVRVADEFAQPDRDLGGEAEALGDHTQHRIDAALAVAEDAAVWWPAWRFG